MKLVKTIMRTAGILLIASMLLCSCQSTKTNGSTTVSGDSDYSDSADDALYDLCHADNVC